LGDGEGPQAKAQAVPRRGSRINTQTQIRLLSKGIPSIADCRDGRYLGCVPHYSKAPIVEALIDIQTRIPDSTTVDQLRGMHGLRSDEFPELMALERDTVKVQFTPFDPPSADGARVGYGFLSHSKDKSRAWRVTRDGFTYSQVGCYDRWEVLRDEARPLWDLYRQTISPEAISRVAVKYVNRFDLPLPIRDFKDYFRTYPEVSPVLPQGLAGLFTQLLIPYDDLGAMLVLTQALVPPPRTEVVSFVLDIDLFVANISSSDDKSIWDLLEKLRTCKNEVFEGCITDAARELIK
jgi:uncharacterized protein (TIGR04255 family)